MDEQIRIGETLTAEQLDVLHDAGGDLTPYLDRDKTIRPGRAVQRVNVDFPTELLRAIDAEATRIGVSRQAFIKMRLADLVAPAAPRAADRIDVERILARTRRRKKN